MGNNLQQQGVALITDALKINSTVIKLTGNTALSDAISIKITKNNKLLQEKLKDLVNLEFVSKSEGELYKGLLILVKQLYGSMSG